MATKETARLWLLYVGGTPAAFGSETNSSLSRSHTPVGVTDKSSSGWEEDIGGLRSWTLEASGFYIADDTAYAAIETAYSASTTVTVYLRDTNNEDNWYGSAHITALNLTAPNPDAVQQSISFKGTGALTGISTY